MGKTDKKYLIIYHKEDNDGLFSMAIAYNYLKEELHISNTKIELFGADYNDIDKINVRANIIGNYDVVIMTDISFNNWDTMKELIDAFNTNFWWIDHHAPIIHKSIEEGYKNIRGIRDVCHSALYNAFKFFYSDKEMPELFKILSAYDSWTYEAEKIDFDLCRLINQGTYNKYNLDTENIIIFVNKLIYGRLDFTVLESINRELKKRGEFECEVLDRQNESMVKNFGDMTWTVGPDNRTACILFIEGPSYSGVFDSCKDKVQHGIVFKHKKDGTWTLSLYNTNNQHDFHCGEYLRDNYGGGGHEGAAGAQITEDTFIKLLKQKKI